MVRFFFLVWCSMSIVTYGQQLTALQFQEEIHDFGYVRESAGPVMYQFDFINTSSRPVKILSVKASCGCTTPDWSKDPIPSGKTGFIQAVFNPTGRPGYFSKTLTVLTDFDSNPIVLQIKGQVSSRDGMEQDDFKVSKGNWRLRGTLFNVGRVYLKDEFVAKEFPVHNSADHELKVLKVDAPDYIRVDAIPLSLKPGETGKIRVSYNGFIKNQYGFQSDHVDIQTNDEEMPTKSFTVYATIEEYFGDITPEKILNAPKIQFEKISFDFGSIIKDKLAKRSLIVTNTGKSELVIRYIQPNCTCVTGKATSQFIKPGGSTTIEIAFDPTEREGSQNKSVSVYSNDPTNPVQRITFTANIGS